jgi:hypothetical protein
MGYAISDSVVRADRFKPSGKWYDSIALEMGDFFERNGIHEAIKAAMLRQGVALEKDWSLVVLDPYHKHSHPIMLRGE